MNLIKKLTLPAGAVLITLLSSAGAFAQRLPDLQKQPLRITSPVTIDGKADDWTGNFKAFNKSTEVYYTVANDDERLYFIIRADRRNIINKIINGGIAITIKKGGKKAPGQSITFPVFKGNDRPSVDFSGADWPADDKEAAKKAASSMLISNLSINSFGRFIRTSGIAGVDTLVTVDNDKGIKAATAVDIKMALTVEFAIDLKLLGLSAAQPDKFAYHVELKAVDQSGIPEVAVIDVTEGLRNNNSRSPRSGLNATANNVDTDSLQNLRISKSEQYSSSRFNTDFTGEYILAK